MTPEFPTEMPSEINSNETITYEITRWDQFMNWMTMPLRNRLLQGCVLVGFAFNCWLTLAPDFKNRPTQYTLLEGVKFLVLYLSAMTASLAIMALANAFLFKHRGVVGRHVLEITEQGFIERTDYNETLHRWPSIRRIISIGPHLYIYISDNASHQVPKRSLSPQDLSSFEAELRSRMVV